MIFPQVIFIDICKLGITLQIIRKKENWQNPKWHRTIFISISEKRLPVGKHVSHLYKRLLTDMVGNTYNIKEKWEIEANTIIEDELWDKLCHRCHKGIIVNSGRNSTGKLKCVIFILLGLFKFCKRPLCSLCWRQCVKTGDHSHIFWDCSVILEYWENIKKEIEKM